MKTPPSGKKEMRDLIKRMEDALEKNPELLNASLDHGKFRDELRKHWPQIMAVNAALGLPVYEL